MYNHKGNSVSELSECTIIRATHSVCFRTVRMYNHKGNSVSELSECTIIRATHSVCFRTVRMNDDMRNLRRLSRYAMVGGGNDLTQDWGWG